MTFSDLFVVIGLVLLVFSLVFSPNLIKMNLKKLVAKDIVVSNKSKMLFISSLIILSFSYFIRS